MDLGRSKGSVASASRAWYAPSSDSRASSAGAKGAEVAGASSKESTSTAS